MFTFNFTLDVIKNIQNLLPIPRLEPHGSKKKHSKTILIHKWKLTKIINSNSRTNFFVMIHALYTLLNILPGLTCLFHNQPMWKYEGTCAMGFKESSKKNNSCVSFVLLDQGISITVYSHSIWQHSQDYHKDR